MALPPIPLLYLYWAFRIIQSFYEMITFTFRFVHIEALYYHRFMNEKRDSKVGSRAGRELASLRRNVRGVCPVCGTEFEGTTRRQYCSSRCVLRAFRARRKAEERAQE